MFVCLFVCVGSYPEHGFAGFTGVDQSTGERNVWHTVGKWTHQEKPGLYSQSKFSP